jgi:hypothetical protein
MSLRFVDLDAPVSESPDFYVRRSRPTLNELFVLFVVLILVGQGVEYFVHDPLALSAILFTVIGLAAFYATTLTHRHREKQRATEFQNALLASALAIDCGFCLIAKTDSSLVYDTVPEIL